MLCRELVVSPCGLHIPTTPFKELVDCLKIFGSTSRTATWIECPGYSRKE